MQKPKPLELPLLINAGALIWVNHLRRDVTKDGCLIQIKDPWLAVAESNSIGIGSVQEGKPYDLAFGPPYICASCQP
jgi:hypothetical protein